MRKDKMKIIEKIVILGFINHTISVADKFTEKVERAGVKRLETYKDLKEIKEEAELLKKQLGL